MVDLSTNFHSVWKDLQFLSFLFCVCTSRLLIFHPLIPNLSHTHTQSSPHSYPLFPFSPSLFLSLPYFYPPHFTRFSPSLFLQFSYIPPINCMFWFQHFCLSLSLSWPLFSKVAFPLHISSSFFIFLGPSLYFIFYLIFLSPFFERMKRSFCRTQTLLSFTWFVRSMV